MGVGAVKANQVDMTLDVRRDGRAKCYGAWSWVSTQVRWRVVDAFQVRHGDAARGSTAAAADGDNFQTKSVRIGGYPYLRYPFDTRHLRIIHLLHACTLCTFVSSTAAIVSPS